MKIVISGLGEVGTYLADLLIREGHELTLIEKDSRKAKALEQTLDATVIQGSGTLVSVLKSARVEETDLFLALTSFDEINLVSASLAKGLGAKRVLARCHTSTHQEHQLYSYSKHFKIDHFIRPERLTAARLAQYIHDPVMPIVDQFARGTIEVVQMKVDECSDAIGETLCDLCLPERMRVGLVEREGKIFVGTAQTVIEAGDKLILVGMLDAVKKAVEIFHHVQKPRRKRRIVLYGAGDVGMGVIEYFSRDEIDIKIIEPEREVCRNVSELYPWIKMVHGHAISSQLLLEENVMDADVFVAATRDDENNVMSCLQAVKLGIRPCLLTIHRPDYAGVLSDIGDLLGIQATVSPRLVTGEEIIRYVTEDPYLIHWKTPGGDAQIIEMHMREEKTEIYNQAIRKLPWPHGTLILGIERADEIFVPSADDIIKPLDSLFLLTLQSERKNLLKLFESAL